MKHFRFFIWGLLSVLAILLFVAANERTAVEELRMVQIKMPQLADGEDMIRLSDVRTKIDQVFDTPLEGMPLVDIDLEAIEERLLDEPFISTVDAFINAKQDLIVELEQRQPIARIINLTGEQYYIDAKGRKMPLSSNYTPKVLVCLGRYPSLSGASIQDSMYTKDTRYTVDLVETIRKDSFLEALIESVSFDGSTFELYPKVGKFTMKVNKKKSIQKQLEKLTYWMETEFKGQDWNTLEYIDLKVENQVIIGRK